MKPLEAVWQQAKSLWGESHAARCKRTQTQGETLEVFRASSANEIISAFNYISTNPSTLDGYDRIAWYVSGGVVDLLIVTRMLTKKSRETCTKI